MNRSGRPRTIRDSTGIGWIKKYMGDVNRNGGFGRVLKKAMSTAHKLLPYDTGRNTMAAEERRRGIRKTDRWVGTVSPARVSDCWRFANEEITVKQSISVIQQDATSRCDSIVRAIVFTDNPIGIPTENDDDDEEDEDEAKKKKKVTEKKALTKEEKEREEMEEERRPETVDNEIEIPTILNADTVIHERRRLFNDIIRSFLVVGYAVIGIPSHFEDEAFKELAAHVKTASTDKQPKPRDILTGGPMFDLDAKKLLPCYFIPPTYGELRGYHIRATHQVRWYFFPKGANAQYYVENKFRFEVLLPTDSLADYAPAAEENIEENLPIRTPVAALLEEYKSLKHFESLRNVAVGFNAYPLFVMSPVITEKPLAELTSQELTQQAQEQMAQCDAPSEHSQLSTRILPGSTVKIAAPTAAAIIDAGLRKDAEKTFRRTRTSNSTFADTVPVSLNYTRGTGAPLNGELDTVPRDVIGYRSKTLADMSYQWVKQLEAQSINIDLNPDTGFKTSRAISEPNMNLLHAHTPTYAGPDILVQQAQYQDMVFAAFRMTRLLFGLGGGRTGVISGSGSSSSSSAKNAQQAAVNMEKDRYSNFINGIQGELIIATQTLFKHCISPFDGMALSLIFDREARRTHMQHTTIIEALSLYEELHGIHVQGDSDEEDEGEEKAGPKTRTETEQEENEEEPLGYHSSRSEMSRKLREQIPITFQAYSRTVQLLTLLAVAIHGNAVLSVKFVPRDMSLVTENNRVTQMSDD